MALFRPNGNHATVSRQILFPLFVFYPNTKIQVSANMPQNIVAPATAGDQMPHCRYRRANRYIAL
jgi:hypothetical protein